jgi:hypothetical protein
MGNYSYLSSLLASFCNVFHPHIRLYNRHQLYRDTNTVFFYSLIFVERSALSSSFTKDCVPFLIILNWGGLRSGWKQYGDIVNVFLNNIIPALYSLL